MTTARDIGTGPTKPFGSALSPRVNKRIPHIPLVTERPIRPSRIGNGRCLECGSRYFGCGHDPEDDE